MSESEVERGEAAAIREALSSVLDPEVGMSVVDMGFVREITPTEEGVDIKMIFTTPFCPMAQMMVRRVKSAAERVVDRPVNVTLGQEPWDPSMMQREESA